MQIIGNESWVIILIIPKDSIILIIPKRNNEHMNKF